MNTLALLLCFTLNFSIDTNCCNTGVILIPKHQSIAFYKESNNRYILGYIINDTITENYFIGTIYNMKGKYSYIKGSYALDTTDIEGWVETKYLGVYLILENNVPLYSKTDDLSRKKVITNPEWYPLKILKCKGGWLYVNYEDRQQRKSGWLSPRYQCSNPYSTCN